MNKDVVDIYSDGSTAPSNPGPSGYGMYVKHEDGREYMGYGGISMHTTNNVAELVGVTKSLEYIVKNKPHIATIHTDSRYVLDNLKHVSNWKRRGWKTSTDSDVKNKDYWVALVSILDKANKVCTVKMRWCKGHSGIEGNEHADVLANKGRLAIMANPVPADVLSSEVEETVDTVVKPKRQPAVLPLNPLLTGKRWFFLTNVSNEIFPGVYAYPTTTYIDKVAERNKYVGKDLSNSHFSMLFTKQEEPVLKHVQAMFDGISVTGNLPVIVNLSVLAKASIWNETVRTECALLELVGNTVIDAREDLVGNVVNPPREVFKLNTTFDSMSLIYSDYVSDSGGYEFSDITSEVISVKGDKLHKDFTNATKYIMFKHRLSTGKEVNTKINVGLDLPPRNNLAKLAKVAGQETKVYIVSWVENDMCYRCATLVLHGDDVTVYLSPLSNHRFTLTK